MAGHLDVVAWLRSLPEGCELAWSDDCLRVESGYGYGFVDAYVPLLAEELGWNWVWSIFPTPEERAEEERCQRAHVDSLGPPERVEVRFTPQALEDLGISEIRVEVEGVDGWQEVEREDGYTLEEVAAELGIDLDDLLQEQSPDDEGDPLNVALPYDATLEVRFLAGECLGARLRLDDGQEREVAPELLDVEGLKRGHTCELRVEDGVQVRARRVWSIPLLERTLERWATEHAGRDDLRLVARDEISESPLQRTVRDRLELDAL
jgi:hypothetical protein